MPADSGREFVVRRASTKTKFREQWWQKKAEKPCQCYNERRIEKPRPSRDREMPEHFRKNRCQRHYYDCRQAGTETGKQRNPLLLLTQVRKARDEFVIEFLRHYWRK